MPLTQEVLDALEDAKPALDLLRGLLGPDYQLALDYVDNHPDRTPYFALSAIKDGRITVVPFSTTALPYVFTPGSVPKFASLLRGVLATIDIDLDTRPQPA